MASSPNVPVFHAWYQAQVPSTAALLTGGASVEAVAAAIANGTFAVDDCLTLSPNGQPALVVWARSKPEFRNPYARSRWAGPAWPVSFDEPWAAVVPQGGTWSTEHKAESLFGHVVAQLPVGAARLRFPSNGCHSLLSLAVTNRWTKVAEQLLRRPDAIVGDDLTGVYSLEVQRTWAVHPFASGVSLEEKPAVLPVLHCAVGIDDLRLMALLLNAGADPNQASQDGTPVVFRSQSVEAFDLLVQHGARPDLPASHGVTLEVWWQKSAPRHALDDLKRAYESWTSEHLNLAQRQRVRRLTLAQKLGMSGEFRRFHQQVKALGLPEQASWEAQGQEWSWGRLALNFVLQSPPANFLPHGTTNEPLKNNAAWWWALDTALSPPLATGLGEPLIAGVPNGDLLWALSLGTPALAQRWEQGRAMGLWADPPTGDPARMTALARGLTAFTPTAMPRVVVDPSANELPCGVLWAAHLAKAMRLAGHHEAALAVLGAFPVGTGHEMGPLIRQAWAAHRGEAGGAPGRWLAEAALHTLAHWKNKSPLPQPPSPQELERLRQWDGRGEAPVTNVPAWLRVAIDRFDAHGQALDDGAQGQRLEAAMAAMPHPQAWQGLGLFQAIRSSALHRNLDRREPGRGRGLRL